MPPDQHRPSEHLPDALSIELAAVVVAIGADEPHVLEAASAALPSGPFETHHRTLEQGLRAWVAESTGQPLGYVEQLYTFADKDRTVDGRRTVSIGYLALADTMTSAKGASWAPWYRHFPWEDRRGGPPAILVEKIQPLLQSWLKAAPDDPAAKRNAQRVAIAFPADPRDWNEELVLQRYELLWQAGLVPEAARVRTVAAGSVIPGVAMEFDHRRILATAMARLRAKIKYRPVVFELMPACFTLLQLQKAMEAIAGVRLHKQNFRRLVESQGLVEETGALTRTGGRPAKLFAFRRDVVATRAVSGTKLPRAG